MRDDMKKSIFILKIFIVLGTIFMINNVEALELCDVIDVKTINENNHEVICKHKGKDVTFNSKYVIVAPGRTGAKWIQTLAEELDIPYTSQSIEKGVRIETRKEIVEYVWKIFLAAVASRWCRVRSCDGSITPL